MYSVGFKKKTLALTIPQILIIYDKPIGMVICEKMFNTERCYPESVPEQTDKNKFKNSTDQTVY